jgi:hypothetical protein
MRLNDALEAIKGRDDFYFTTEDGVVTIHHTSGQDSGFDEIEGEVFEGARFDEQTGRQLPYENFREGRRVYCDVCGPANMNPSGYVCEYCRDGFRQILGDDSPPWTLRSWSRGNIHSGGRTK